MIGVNNTVQGIRFVVFLFLFASYSSAQYRIDSWTADNGLPQNSVYSIVQTRDGYLWVATLDGLARFDGFKYTVFNKSNSPGIANNRFTYLLEDSAGALWAATEESGVTRFIDGRFTSYSEDSGIPRTVVAITADATGNAIFFDGSGLSFVFKDGAFVRNEAVSELQPTWDRRGSSIRCANLSDERLLCFVQGRGIFFPAVDSSSTRFISTTQTSAGEVWVATNSGKLGRISSDGTVTYLDTQLIPGLDPRQFIDGFSSGLISTDNRQSMWVTDLGTMRSEILLEQSERHAKEFGDIYPPYPNGPIFYSSFSDAEGNYWFGTLRGGLYRARKQTVSTLSTAEGLTDNNAYPIFESSNGTVWVGTTGGLFKYNGDRFELAEDTERYSVTSIAETMDGRIIFSNEGELFIQTGNRFVRYLENVIPSFGSIFALHRDTAGDIWVGGLDHLTRVRGEEIKVFKPADGVVGDSIKVIIDSKDGGLWVGSYGGLSRYQDGRFTTWNEGNGLPSRTIRTLYEDAERTLWIGTYDGGLTRFKDGKFTQFTTGSGLYNDGVFHILEDERGWFWITSNRGIYRVQKSELNEYADGKRSSITSIGYGKSDGMLNVECNGGRWPAGQRAKDGRLWFPTQDGIAVIDPKEVKINSQPPPVAIESVRIGDRSLDRSALEFAVNGSNYEIRLEPHEQNFEIQYTALSFVNSENLRFKYRLEGLDPQWIDAGTRRTAYFSYVPHGHYRFQVIAANADGVWNEVGKSLTIVVLPPFYRTWWFAGLAALILAVTAYLLYRYQVTQNTRRHKLEMAFSRKLVDSQELERKRFAAEMHDGLGQSFVIIKNRARLSQKQLGDEAVMMDHLEKISETASDALEETREIAFNLRPHLLDRLGLTKTVESMLDKVFGATPIELEKKIADIDGLLEKDSEILFYRIIQESVNNIVKHSQAKRASVRIKPYENRIVLTISDDGVGFRSEEQVLPKSGFGLVGISERARLLGGKMHLESSHGKGTTVTVEIEQKK